MPLITSRSASSISTLIHNHNTLSIRSTRRIKKTARSKITKSTNSTSRKKNIKRNASRNNTSIILIITKRNNSITIRTILINSLITIQGVSLLPLSKINNKIIIINKSINAIRCSIKCSNTISIKNTKRLICKVTNTHTIIIIDTRFTSPDNTTTNLHNTTSTKTTIRIQLF